MWWWWWKEDNRNVVVVVEEKFGAGRCGVEVGSLWGQCRVDVLEGK